MIRFETIDSTTGEVHSQYWYDCSDVAKNLAIKDGIKVLGRNKFMQYLRHNGVLMQDSNQPKQSFITLGLMRYHMVKRRYKMWGMPLFSERGIAFLQRKIDCGDYTIGFMKKINKNETIKLEDIC